MERHKRINVILVEFIVIIIMGVIVTIIAGVGAVDMNINKEIFIIICVFISSLAFGFIISDLLFIKNWLKEDGKGR